jgi:RNA polymerase sigma-70 factor, ECF subfamily
VQAVGEKQVNEDLHRDIIAQLPHLRAFALMLARDRTLANDLVQDAVVRALSHADQFQPGTNFKAWISTILRNSYFNEMRRRSRTSQVDIETVRNTPTVSGGQEERLQMRDFERAFRKLPPSQREALALVGASGFSYEEAASVSGCAIGTMKSRVSRARSQLQQMLDGTAPAAAETAKSTRGSGDRNKTILNSALRS